MIIPSVTLSNNFFLLFVYNTITLYYSCLSHLVITVIGYLYLDILASLHIILVAGITTSLLYYFFFFVAIRKSALYRSNFMTLTLFTILIIN